MMERNHDYLYKKELIIRNAKINNTEATIKSLEMMRESKAKTPQICQNDITKVLALLIQLEKTVLDIDGKDPVIKLTEEIKTFKRAID